MCMRIINACVCIQDKLDQLESDEHTILDLLSDSDIVSLLILRLWGIVQWCQTYQIGKSNARIASTGNRGTKYFG